MLRKSQPTTVSTLGNIKMKKVVILTVVFLSFINSAAVSGELEKKDRLSCETYLDAAENKNIELIKFFYRDSIEYLTYFNFIVTKDIINEYKGVDNPGHIAADNFDVTSNVMKMMSLIYIKEQCQSEPDLKVEQIIRALWISMQQTMNDRPEMKWDYKFNKDK